MVNVMEKYVIAFLIHYVQSWYVLDLCYQNIIAFALCHWLFNPACTEAAISTSDSPEINQMRSSNPIWAVACLLTALLSLQLGQGAFVSSLRFEEETVKTRYVTVFKIMSKKKKKKRAVKVKLFGTFFIFVFWLTFSMLECLNSRFVVAPLGQHHVHSQHSCPRDLWFPWEPHCRGWPLHWKRYYIEMCASCIVVEQMKIFENMF